MPVEHPRNFRIGLLRDRTDEFKPLISIATTSDGGLMIAPRAVPKAVQWSYGVARPRDGHGYRVDDIEITDVRPKLHWHRSGWTAISLTGTRLRPARAKFKRLADLRAAQIASIVVERPWAYPSAQLKTGDQMFVVDSWPMHFGVEISAYFVPPGRSLNTVRSRLPAVGMLDGDSERTVVDMRGRGLPAFLVFRYRVSNEYAAAAATSVLAGPLSRTPGVNARAVALWSGASERPKVTVDDPPPVSIFFGPGRTLDSDEDALSDSQPG